MQTSTIEDYFRNRWRQWQETSEIFWWRGTQMGKPSPARASIKIRLTSPKSMGWQSCQNFKAMESGLCSYGNVKSELPPATYHIFG